MAWLGKVTLGNLSSDLAAKLSESVKSIERNFDTALGLEESNKRGSFLDGIVGSAVDQEQTDRAEEAQADRREDDTSSQAQPDRSSTSDHELPQEEEESNAAPIVEGATTIIGDEGEVGSNATLDTAQENAAEQGEQRLVQLETSATLPDQVSQQEEVPSIEESAPDVQDEVVARDESTTHVASPGDDEAEAGPLDEAGKLRVELKMMEKALQGAAKQAQLKADEISRLLQENEHLKFSLEEAKKKRSEAELDALREEYQHRLGAAERKVYALTKERDMLRREQNRKSDSSMLLKEKDEIIKQVMAEGEELSKKQAAQEAQIRKLRAQVRELEEEKQRLSAKLQVEEVKVESIRKDKAATEKVLQETIEKGHADLAAQREFYTKIVNEAREAEERAEARANSQAKADLDHRLHEAQEREMALVQALEELRLGISRTEQQAALREDSLRKDMEDLERRCQAAEARYDELVARVPESTRPLLRQIEAMQESSAMRAEAWSGVERALNSRLQEAETKAAAAQERERAMNERLSQTLSRIAVMEAQVSCLKAELSQVNRALEKERLRASESRQEYLAALETAATHEGRGKQLEQELQDLKEKHMRVLAEERSRRLTLEQELEAEQAARTEQERRLRSFEAEGSSHTVTESGGHKGLRRLPSVSSGNNIDEAHFLQASLESTSPVRDRLLFKFGDPVSPHLGKSMVSAATLEQYESLMRHKEGEMSSYAARLAELESTRNSLAEELVRTTTQCEKLQGEVSTLAGLRSELEALRRRHASALELMGERDEQVEELRADLADVKQMYREQVDMLVGQIERLSSATANALG